jgi:hypothetical protein
MTRYFLMGLLMLGIGGQSGVLAAANPCGSGTDGSYPDDASTGPVKYRTSHIVVAIHKGPGGTPLVPGFTVIDKPVTFHCRNESGCLVSATANIDHDVAGFFVCVLADGHPMRPQPVNNASVALESARLPTGPHILQTETVSNAGTLGPWEVNYTMYDK